MVTGGIPAESPFPGLGPLVDRLGVDLEEIATGENLLFLGLRREPQRRFAAASMPT